MNWARVENERKTAYRPRAGAQPATQPQIDYILDLARRKGQPKPKLPSTKRGASNLIERLLELPDTPGGVRTQIATEPLPVSNETRVELVKELRETFPILTPMMANYLVGLAMVIDELGAAFFFSDLAERMDDETPTNYAEELIPWIMNALLDWLE